MNARDILFRYGLRPQKSLGQNFLTDPHLLDKIVSAAGLDQNDVVLEVGPGLGHLTQLLSQQAGRVIAIELDSHLVTILRHQLGEINNIKLIEGNILKLDIPSLLPPATSNYKVVANLPYYITAAVLRHFTTAKPSPSRMVITMQLEVAQRITAQPGKMSLLAISVQFYGQPNIVTRLKAGAFYPRPEVESAVVRIDRHTSPSVDVPDERPFFAVVKAGFAQRRKQLRNSLAAGLQRSRAEISSALKAAGIDPRRRPQTLSLPEWAAITNQLQTEN